MTSAGKTLIIISPGFPENEKDTTCLPTQQLFVRALNRNFPDLKIIVVSLQYPYRNITYSWFGNSVHPLNGKSIPKFLRPWFWLKTFFNIRSIIRKPDVLGILSFWCQEAALIGQLVSRAAGLKHLIWIKGQDAKAGNAFVRLIRPKSQQLVALSDFLADEFETNHSVKPAHVIPNGVEQGMYTEVVNKEIDIIGVGSLIPLKQYFIFIDVIKEVVKVKPDLRAVLIGKGPQEESIRHKINSSGLRDNVSMLGELSHVGVIRMMQHAKILLHPSSYEGYSTVCLEALAAGCRVVSFVAAEKKPVANWYIAADKEEMTRRCIYLLNSYVSTKPVIFHTIDDSAKEMIKLFTAHV